MTVIMIRTKRPTYFTISISPTRLLHRFRFITTEHTEYGSDNTRLDETVYIFRNLITTVSLFFSFSVEYSWNLFFFIETYLRRVD